MSIASFLFPHCRLRGVFLLFFAAILPFANTPAAAPRDNPYDVIGKVFAPFWSVLLSNGRDNGREKNRSMIMTLRMTAVTGRLSQEFQGAILHAWVQFPDKLKLQAPVLGELSTVCRDGNLVWATPGKKVEFLLGKFEKVGHGLPGDLPVPKTPLPLPITAQQAVFLPALFTVQQADVAEIASLNGEDNRLITAGLMPELAKATKSEDFLSRLWVAAGYVPKRVEIVRRDFTCTVDITDLKFEPSLPEETWKIPAGTVDVYRTNANKIQALLYVIMNSLQKNSNSQAATAPSSVSATPPPSSSSLLQ